MRPVTIIEAATVLRWDGAGAVECAVPGRGDGMRRPIVRLLIVVAAFVIARQLREVRELFG